MFSLPKLKASLIIVLIIAISAISFFPQAILAAAGINRQINFQGKLVNTNGTNVTDGSYDVEFNLYTASSGGSALWTENQTVTATDGIFRVQLGSVSSFGSLDFAQDTLWLGITVESDLEMTPRVRFTTTPYAFVAERIYGTSTITTGTINSLTNSSLAPAASSTGTLLGLTYANNSANTSGTSTTVGLSLAGTNAANGSGGTMETYGIKLADIAGTPSSGTQNNYGIRIGNQGQSGAETAYGLYIDAQSGATNNYAAIFAGGNVGIGTTGPSALLHLANDSGGSMKFTDSDDARTWTWSQTDTGKKLELTSPSSSTLISAYNDGDAVTITGLIGQAKYSGAIAAQLRGASGQSVNIVEIQNNSGTALSVFDAAGNLGIGTSVPSSELHVVGGARITGLVSCDTIDTDANGVLSCGTDTGGVSGSGTTNYLARWTSSSAIGDSVIYDNGTNVGIGTTTVSGGLLSVGSAGQLTISSGGNLSTSGNIATSGSGTITSAGTLTASNGFTQTTGALNLTATSGSISATGLSSASLSVTSGTLALATATSGDITLTTGAAAGLANILTGNLKVGNGTPTLPLNGEDAYIEGTFEVDGVARFENDTSFVLAGTNTVDITNSSFTTVGGLLDLNATTSTSFTSNLDVATTFTSTGATTSYGINNNWASSAIVTGSSVSQTAYANYNTAVKSGADTATGTYTLYGSYNDASNTGRTNVGTANTYGGYFGATGDTNGTSTAYGLYATASGADTNYGIYSAAGWNYFAGNVGFGTASPDAIATVFQGTTSGSAFKVYRDQAVSDAVVASIVQDNSADDLSTLFLQQDGDGYALEVFNQGTDNGIMVNSYSVGNTWGKRAIETYASGTYDTTGGTATNYSGYFTVDSTRSSGSNNLINVGIFAAASGAQVNYAGIFTGGNVGIGTTAPSATLHVTGGARITGLASCDTIDTDANGVLSCGTDTGGVSGSGTTNYLARWTSSSAIGDSVVYDNGTNVGIGTTTVSGGLVNIGSAGQLTISSGGNLSTSGNIATSGSGTITSAGAITGPTSTNTINGLIVNSGALSGISTISTSSTINSQTISSAANFTGTMAVATSLTTPIIYGGTGASSTLTLAGTSNGSPSGAHISLNGSGQGNVGIGTTSPAAQLHVAGITKVTGTDNALITVNGSSTAYDYTGRAHNDLIIGGTATVGNHGIAQISIGFTGDANRAIQFGTASSSTFNGSTTFLPKVTFTTGGNVGIGTTTPSRALHVVGNARITSLASCDTIDTDANGNLACGTDSGGITGTGTANYVARWTGTSSIGTGVLYDNGTNVGIGTTTVSGGLVNIGSTGQLTISSGGNLSTSGNIATTGSGTITSAGTLTASNGFTQTTGALNLTATSGSISATGLSSASLSVTSGTLALATATSGNITLTTGAASGLANVLTGNLKVGNGSPSLTLNGEDAYIEGTLDVASLAHFGADVGIGTTSPDEVLHIRNASPLVMYDRNGNYNWIQGIYDGSTDLGNGSGNAGDLSDFILYDQSANDTRFLVEATTGNVGIGTVGPAGRLDVQGTLTTTSGFLAQSYNWLTAAPASSSSGYYLASWNRVENTTNQNITGTAYGLYNEVLKSGTGTLSNAIGLSSNIKLTSTGTITAASGINLSSEISAAGTITTYNGINIENVWNSGGTGTLTNQYGIKVAALTTGTNNAGLTIDEATGTKNTNLLIGTSTIPTGSYSIYNSSTDQNYFAGNVAIGTTTAAYPLQVVANTTSYALTAYNNNASGWGQYIYANSNSGSIDALTVAGSGGTVFNVRTNGNVGIGTGSPSTNLHVVGGARITGLASCDTIDTDANGVLSCGTDSGGVTGTGTANYLARWTGTSSLGIGVVYDNGTNVGIGTTTVSGGLVNIGSTGQLTISSAGNLATSGTITGPTIYGGTNTNSTLTLAGTSNGSPSGANIILNGSGQGNVGIGMSSAMLSPLHVHKDGSGSVVPTLTLGGSTTAGGGNSLDFALIGAGVEDAPSARIAGVRAASGSCAVSPCNGELVFSTYGSGALTERMRIATTGNVGIGGDTTPNDLFSVGSSSQFQVNSSGNIDSIGGAAHSISNSSGALLIDSASTGAIGIGTSANAKTITIGNSTGTTALNFTSGTGAQTHTSSVTTGSTTTSAFVYTAAALTTGTGMYVNTGSSNTLTTGTLSRFVSTSTGLTTGGLMNLDWSPGSSVSTYTGDLFSINAGSNALSGFLLNLKDAGTSIFSASKTQFSTSLPTNFTAVGDMAIAYDINFTNPTASYIKSAAPLYIAAGETFGSSDLNLTTYNTGNIYLNTSTSGNTIIPNGNVAIGTTDTTTYKLRLNGQPAANGYTAWTNYSDARLKNNIAYVEDGALDKILQLKPAQYNYNGLTGFDEETQHRRITGFIAQDLKEVFPEMVGTTYLDGQEYYDTNLSALPIYLVQAMKELTDVVLSNPMFNLDEKGNVVIAKAKVGELVLDPNLNPSLSEAGSLGSLNITINNFENRIRDLENGVANTNGLSFSEQLALLNSVTASQNEAVSEIASDLSDLRNDVVGIATQSAVLAATVEQVATQSAILANNTNDIATSSAALAALRDQVNNLNLTPPDVLMATGSAELANLQVNNQLVAINLDAYDATISGSFRAFGNSFLSNTIVAGDFSQDGTLSITNGDSINALGVLKFQNNILAQGVDFFNGLVTIDNAGTIASKKIITEEIQLVAGKTSGSATILAGQTTTDILNELVKSNSRILITPTVAIDKALAVVEKIEGTKFKVALPSATPANVTFDYLIINEVNQ